MGTYEDEVPLLADKMEYANCPGCKCAHLSAKGAPPPVKQLIMVSSVILCNVLPISSLLSYLYFMIDDFHIAKRTEDIGYYAGAIVSIFMVARGIFSVPWGMFADKYGRRPVFFVGLSAIVVLQPIFGTTKSYWVAFACRFLLGSFNGILGPLKAFASEICSPESQAWGLTIVSTTWSLGLIIGPAIGGFLARPVINFPGIFREDSIFASYPYLLPSLIQAGFALIELVVIYHLPETIHFHDEKKPSDVEEPMVKSVKSKKPSLWKNWPLMATVMVYCLWSLHELSFTEIFSMWCVSPKETGGLALRTSDVGTILSINGFGMLCGQLVLFPSLAKFLGPILVTRVPAILVIPMILAFPVMPYLHGQVQWLCLTIVAVLRNSMSVMVFTGSFLLLNNAVGTDQRGAANGISLTCGSIFRAVGPAAGGAIFSWGQLRHNATFLPGSQLVFAILDVICVVAVFTTFPPFLPKRLDKPYDEWTMTMNDNDKKDEPVLR